MRNTSGLERSTCDHCGHLLDGGASNHIEPCVTQPFWTLLSHRERQVVELVQRAKSNKEIAFELSLTVGSVKEYLHRIFRKLALRNRTELALWGSNTMTRSQQDVLR